MLNLNLWEIKGSKLKSNLLTDPVYLDLKNIKESSLISVCPMSDFFILEAQELRFKVWDVIKKIKRNQYMILTNNIENAQHFFRAIIQFDKNEKHKKYKNILLGVKFLKDSKNADILFTDPLLLAGKKFIRTDVNTNIDELKKFLNKHKPDFILFKKKVSWNIIIEQSKLKKINDLCNSKKIKVMYI